MLVELGIPFGRLPYGPSTGPPGLQTQILGHIRGCICYSRSMVRRVDKKTGAVWHEPPLTKKDLAELTCSEAELDFYRRYNAGPMTIVHGPPPAPRKPEEPKEPSEEP